VRISISLAGKHSLQGIYVAAGIIQAVVTGTSPDGVIDWWLHWVPVEAGATVVAA